MQKMTVIRLVALAGVVACADDATTPTGTKDGAVSPQVAVNLNVANSGSLDFAADLETIRASVLPGFTDAAVADSMRAELTALQEQLAAGDRTAVVATLTRSRTLMTDATNATDLGYIEMVFGNIDTALARR